MSGTVSGVVRGLMAADGLGWQNLYRRSRLLAPWTRRKRREIEAEHEQHGIIDEALPFALNQPTTPFRSSPGVNSEWLTFQLQILIDGGGRYQRDKAIEAWLDLAARRDQLRLTVGQHAAVKNLGLGKSPPVSGNDNPHYFEDSACFRAIAMVCVGQGDLQGTIESDAQISNSQDGIWAAHAFAAALQGALDSADANAAVDRARQRIPAESWTSIEVDRALRNAAEATSLFDLIERLANESANHAYDYGNTAPETLAISLAIYSFTGGELEPSLLAALALPRTAASVAPMIGALCGALGEGPAHEPPPLRGLALPHLAGVRTLALLDQLHGTTV